MVGMSLRFPSGYVALGDALDYGIHSANAKHSSGRGHDPQGAQDLGLAGRALSKEHGRICRKACDYRQVTQFPQDAAGSPAPAIAVIDTNAILDAWWFLDPRATGLVLAVEAGHLIWMATRAMREELQDVLMRRPFVDQPIRCKHTLSAFNLLVRVIDDTPAPAPWTCADPDDQCFVDLALARQAHWLFTRDRALLDLAHRAAGHGCRIVPPSAWPEADGQPTSAADPVP